MIRTLLGETMPSLALGFKGVECVLIIPDHVALNLLKSLELLRAHCLGAAVACQTAVTPTLHVVITMAILGWLAASVVFFRVMSYLESAHDRK